MQKYVKFRPKGRKADIKMSENISVLTTETK